MTLHTHNHQQSGWTPGTDQEPPEDSSARAQANPLAAHHDEQAARAVMHPDYHDPDWRYYFGAMAVAH